MLLECPFIILVKAIQKQFNLLGIIFIMGEEKKENEPKKLISEEEVILFAILAIIGRIAMEPFSSVEPIIPIAVYVALAYGMNAGLIIGLIAYPVSNFFMDGGVFGFWTILQATGGGLSGAIAGGKELTMNNLITYTLIGTIIFEILLNITWGALLVWPYSITHIVTNIGFAVLLGVAIGKK